MKKYLSLFLSIIIIISALIVPVNFVSAEGEDYLNHYTFSFAESDVPTYIGYTNGPKGDTSSTAGITYTSRGGEDVSIYPLVSVHNYNLNYWVPLAYYTSTAVGGTNYDSVYLDTSYDTMWVPLDKNGNPFELAPGHTYKVDISYWQKNAATDTSYDDSGLYVGGGYVAPHLPQEYNYENATVEGFGGTYASRPYGAKVDDLRNIDSTGIITRSVTFTTPAANGEGYTYDAEKNAYTATVTTSGGTTELDFYNIFYINFNQKAPTEVAFTSLEITRDDYTVDWDALLPNQYEFSFAESDVPTYIGYTNGPKGDTSSTAGITYTSRGGEDVSIYPLVSIHNYNLNYWVPLAYYTSTAVGGTNYDSVYLDTSNDTMWVPLDKDGKPFELAPGHTYKVDISYWQKNAATDTSYDDSGLYVGGGYVAPHLPQEYNYENATVEGFGGTYASRPYGAKVDDLRNIDSTGIITHSVTFTTPAANGEGYTYNAIKNAYTATVTTSSGTAELDFYNIFYINFNQKAPTEVAFTSLKITRDDYSVQSTVEYIDTDGSVMKQENAEVGEYSINYLPENTTEKYFAGWFYDASLTQRVRTANVELTESGLKLYAKWDTYKDSVVTTNPGDYYSSAYLPNIATHTGYSHILSTISGNSGTTGTNVNGHLNLSTTIWRDGIVLGATNSDGELFRAEANTTYRISLKFRITAETTREDGIDVEIAPGAGLTTNDDRYPMGKFSNEDGFKAHGSYTVYSDTVSAADEYINYTTLYTTGEFDTVPAIGVEFIIYNGVVAEIYELRVEKANNVFVSYVENGEVTESKEISLGGNFTIDYVPENTKDKYFAGWYSDAEFTQRIKTATLTALTEDVKLYGKWESYKDSVVTTNPSDYYSSAYLPNMTTHTGYNYLISTTSGKTGTTGTKVDGHLNLSTTEWGDGILVAATNFDGELFRAAPNTTYRISLKFRITAETTREDGVEVQLAPGAGLTNENDERYPMGRFNGEDSFKSHGSYTKYADGVTADGEYVTYTAVYTTGEFDTIPAIGVEFWIYNGAVAEIYQLTVEKFDGVDLSGKQFKAGASVQNKTSYKVTFNYILKTTPADDINIGFKTTAADGIGYPAYIEGMNTPVYTISALKETGVTHTATVLLTTDMYASVTDGNGGDDTLTLLNTDLYAYLIGEADITGIVIFDVNAIVLTNTAGGALIGVNGGQCLNSEAEAEANSQAMRYSFTYDSKTGSEIYIDGVAYTVKERGFIYANGDTYTNENSLYAGDMNLTEANGEKYVVYGKTEDFSHCWNIEEIPGADYNSLTFSTYVSGFGKTDDRELMAKGYVVVEIDGQEFVLYSDSINRSIDYIKFVNDDTINSNERRLVWGYDFSEVNNISEVTYLHQDNNRNNYQTNEIYNPVYGGENWVVEDGVMKLKATYSTTDTSKYDIPYTVSTKGKMAYKYGYLELVADIPFEYGIHAGLWLCPQNEYVGAGADDKVNVEVDVFEVFGVTERYLGLVKQAVPTTNIHKWYHYGNETKTVNLATGSTLQYNSGLLGNYSIDDRKYVMDLEEGRKTTFTYGFEWNPEYMAFSVNGNEYFRVNISEGNNFYIDGHEYSKNMACLHEELYVLFGFGIDTSGALGDSNDASKIDDIIAQSSNVDNSPNSIDYRIHSIKLYQREGETLKLGF